MINGITITVIETEREPIVLYGSDFARTECQRLPYSIVSPM